MDNIFIDWPYLLINDNSETFQYLSLMLNSKKSDQSLPVHCIDNKIHWTNVNWYPFTIKEESCNCQNNAFWSKNVDHHILIPSFISWVSALTWSDTLEFKNFIWSNHEISKWCQRKKFSCSHQHKIKFFTTSNT